MGATGRGLGIDRFIESLELLRRAYLLYAVVWLEITMAFPFFLSVASLNNSALGFAAMVVYAGIFVGLVIAFLYYFRRGIVLFSSVAGFDPRLRGLRKYGNLLLAGVAFLVLAFFSLLWVIASKYWVAVLLLILSIVVGLALVEISVFLPMFRIGRVLGVAKISTGATLSLIPVFAIIGGLMVFSGLGSVMKRISPSS